VPEFHKVTAANNGHSRRETRTISAEPVEIANLSGRWTAEPTSTQNISSHGARLTTHRVWEPGSFVLLKFLRGTFWARARVVYWRSFSSSRFSIGLEFIEYGGSLPVSS
jgi:hypothetical protein